MEDNNVSCKKSKVEYKHMDTALCSEKLMNTKCDEEVWWKGEQPDTHAYLTAGVWPDN